MAWTEPGRRRAYRARSTSSSRRRTWTLPSKSSTRERYLAGAVLAGPASATGAQEQLAAADEAEPQDPEAALGLVRAAQAALDKAGFPAHAYVLDDRVVALLLRLERRPEAARLLLDRLWSRIAADQPDDAAMTLRALEGLDGPPEEGDTDSGDGPAGNPFVQAAIRNARRALVVRL